MLLDLDGVICDDRHRVQHALDREWGTYFGLMVNDTPWPQGRQLYDAAILTGWDFAYLTGRREDTREWTLQWLVAHGYAVDVPLLMRPQDERRKLGELKADVVRQLLRKVPRVRLYDDDPDVIEHVAAVPGAEAYHCTWHIKPKRLVHRGQS